MLGMVLRISSMDEPHTQYTALIQAREMGYNITRWLNAYREDFQDRGITQQSITQGPNGYIASNQQERLLTPIIYAEPATEHGDEIVGDSNVDLVQIHQEIGEFFIRSRNEINQQQRRQPQLPQRQPIQPPNQRRRRERTDEGDQPRPIPRILFPQSAPHYAPPTHPPTPSPPQMPPQEFGEYYLTLQMKQGNK